MQTPILPHLLDQIRPEARKALLRAALNQNIPIQRFMTQILEEKAQALGQPQPEPEKEGAA